MLKANVLGQLLLMQSMLINLPDKKSIFSFICRGLLDIPGIENVSFSEAKTSSFKKNCIKLLLKRSENIFGELTIEISDRKNFEPYYEYIKNFIFMVEVILEERYQHELNELHKAELENRVEERTVLLKKEIEQRKLIEANLRHSEKLFRTSFESATAGVCLVKPDGTFLKANAKFCKISGYTETELKKKKFNDITHKEDLKIGISAMKDLLNGKVNNISFEKRYLNKSEEIVFAHVSTALVKSPSEKPLYFVTYIQDITKAKRIQDALVKSEEKYRSLFENMTTGFVLNEIICDEKGKPIDFRYIEANPAYEKLTGQPVKKLINKTIKEVLPNIESYWIDTFGKVALTGIPVSFQNYVSDLGKYYDTWTFSPSKNKFAVVFTDVTEQILSQQKLRKNEKKLKEQNKNYEALNKELTRTNKKLEKAKKKAEESDRLKSAFLANMSHEVRTPMNGIIGFSEMLLKPNLTNEKRSFFVKTLISCSKQLLKIVNDILDISKIEAGEIEISKEEVVLNDVLMELYATYKFKTEEKDIELYVSKGLKNQDSKIYIDKTRLSQILINLLENAFKFTYQGSVKFGYRLNKNFLSFFVKDTGIGIEQKMQERIFDRFRQVELEMTRQFGGTGLGLSISKKLVELQGGEIWLESKKDEGTIFFFTIPYRPVEKKNNLEFENNPTTKKEKDYTILVAEDIETNFLLIEEILIDLNLNILQARNGTEAIELSKNNSKISLVLMDIKMPEMDGYEAAKLIKFHRPKLPIIAQSAYAQEQDIKKFNDCFDSYITKPIDNAKLINLVKQYVTKNEKQHV